VGDRVGRKKRVVYHCEWKGTTLEPLSPRSVIKELKSILDTYHLSWCYTDQWAADALKDMASEEGLMLVIEDWTAKEKVDCFLGLRDTLSDLSVEIPNDPILLQDMKMVKRSGTNKGPSIILPKTNDGRHCDYAASIARLFKRWIDDEQPEKLERGSEAYFAEEERKDIEREEEHLATSNSDWWEKSPWEQ
jgi:hypothetical protein